MNKEENEQIIKWAIDELKVKIVSIDFELKNVISGFEVEEDEILKKAIRVLPNENYEGFFVAKLQKRK